MGTRIEVMPKGEIDSDSDGLILQKPIKAYNIDDSFTDKEISAIENLLADPVVDDVAINQALFPNLWPDSVVIEKSPLPGVNDPEGKEARNTIQKLLDREIDLFQFHNNTYGKEN